MPFYFCKPEQIGGLSRRVKIDYGTVPGVWSESAVHRHKSDMTRNRGTGPVSNIESPAVVAGCSLPRGKRFLAFDHLPATVRFQVELDVGEFFFSGNTQIQ